jgi:hypothetical protein
MPVVIHSIKLLTFVTINDQLGINQNIFGYKRSNLQILSNQTTRYIRASVTNQNAQLTKNA